MIIVLYKTNPPQRKLRSYVTECTSLAHLKVDDTSCLAPYVNVCLVTHLLNHLCDTDLNDLNILTECTQ